MRASLLEMIDDQNHRDRWWRAVRHPSSAHWSPSMISWRDCKQERSSSGMSLAILKEIDTNTKPMSTICLITPPSEISRFYACLMITSYAITRCFRGNLMSKSLSPTTWRSGDSALSKLHKASHYPACQLRNEGYQGRSRPSSSGQSPIRWYGFGHD